MSGRRDPFCSFGSPTIAGGDDGRGHTLHKVMMMMLNREPSSRHSFLLVCSLSSAQNSTAERGPVDGHVLVVAHAMVPCKHLAIIKGRVTLEWKRPSSTMGGLTTSTQRLIFSKIVIRNFS